MPISPHLHRTLQEKLGADAGEDLGNVLNSMDATRADVAEFRHEMQRGFARIEARFEQMENRWDARFAGVEARFSLLEAKISSVDQKLDQRLASLDRKTGDLFNAGLAKAEAMIEKGLKDQTRFFFLAWSVILASIIGLYAR